MALTDQDIKKLPKFQQVQFEFAKNLRNPAKNKTPDAIETRRMKIYQDLFYNNVQTFCANSFPILRSLTPDDKWHRMVRDFFTEYRAHSPYFIDISKEFLTYISEHRPVEKDDYPFMLELAHWEWMEVHTVAAKDNILKIPHERNGDLMNEKVVISSLAWPLVYEYPVHRVGDAYQPQDKPEQPTFLIISRNRKHQVDFFEANPLTYRLLEIFQEHSENNIQISGLQALKQLIDELNYPQPEQLIAGGQQILQDLLQRDIILGVNS
ncbi:MAG: putative DNA-binding domain-containing protein [Kangiellaceae bacterium]|nr:putative DNA-binding domain-containing protein [Kangiellaceae bacterium]